MIAARRETTPNPRFAAVQEAAARRKSPAATPPFDAVAEAKSIITDHGRDGGRALMAALLDELAAGYGDTVAALRRAGL
jgi:hypothetical protein